MASSSFLHFYGYLLFGYLRESRKSFALSMAPFLQQPRCNFDMQVFQTVSLASLQQIDSINTNISARGPLLQKYCVYTQRLPTSHNCPLAHYRSMATYHVSQHDQQPTIHTNVSPPYLASCQTYTRKTSALIRYLPTTLYISSLVLLFAIDRKNKYADNVTMARLGDFSFPDFNYASQPDAFPSTTSHSLPVQASTVYAPSSSAASPPAGPVPGAKRKSEAISSQSPTDGSSTFEDASRLAAEEDKRRRNTAASARFRVKKKQREQALEKSAKEMSDKVAALEGRINQLETENKWLKNLITEKNESKEDIAALWKKVRFAIHSCLHVVLSSLNRLEPDCYFRTWTWLLMNTELISLSTTQKTANEKPPSAKTA